MRRKTVKFVLERHAVDVELPEMPSLAGYHVAECRDPETCAVVRRVITLVNERGQP